MYKDSGTAKSKPLLMLHGGAGPVDGNPEFWDSLRPQLKSTVFSHWDKIRDGMPAVEAVTALVHELESLEDFNAGKGAYLQNDGLARLSASLMDGAKEIFSGVHLVTNIHHPSELCQELQNREHTVFGPHGAQLIARDLGIKTENPVTLAQIDRWRNFIMNKFGSDSRKGGTVGAVVLDTQGRLASATSTGGDASNPPQRMSDSATVAGNFASPFAAISCTGIGEQIVNDALAARIETRVRDGKTVVEASDLSWDEGRKRKRLYGWIALDSAGNWAVCNLRDDMVAAVMSTEMKEPQVFNRKETCC